MAALAEFVGIDSITLSGMPLPLTLRLPNALSDEELIAFSQCNRPYRIERNADGELEIMSPNGVRGAHLEAFVIRALGDWAEDHGGIVVSSQGGFRLADTSIRMADASWISSARWDALSDEEQEGFTSMSPDFLVEIRSKSDSRPTLEAKMAMWIANGAQLAWMIDPFAADLTVYRQDLPPQTLTRPDWVEADTVVPGFRLETSRLWAK